MEIRVVSVNTHPNKEGVFLIEDNWNDWYEFKTTYTLKVITSDNEIYEIGSVKIGQFNMTEKNKRPDIPTSFKNLSNDFFSLGQGIDYYDNLKKLGVKFRQNILKALNDMAYNDEIYQKCKNEKVTIDSLMRFYKESSVVGQFRRISNGGVRLTNYHFEYTPPSFVEYRNDISKNQVRFKVEVTPESNPPTNIHVVTGKNGVGKTQFIRNIVNAIINENTNNEYGYFTKELNTKVDPKEIFSNVICISFSAFDDLSTLFINKSNSIPVNFIGLDDVKNNTSLNRQDILKNKFLSNLINVIQNKSNSELWEKIINLLSYDNFIRDSGIIELASKEVSNSDKDKLNEEIIKLFLKLSSGHKIILLTIVCLVNEIEEKSLLIFDEPETHLHPPLLATLIRIISIILIELNGVAIIATHSPIVLQEVPKKCANIMLRSNNLITIQKPIDETFGTNINSLTREVFGFEVEKSGFHQLIQDSLEKWDFDRERVNDEFKFELGDEARAFVNLLFELKKGNL